MRFTPAFPLVALVTLTAFAAADPGTKPARDVRSAPPSATQKSFQAIDTVDFRVTGYSAAASQPLGSWVTAFCFAPDGSTWVGTDDGIAILDAGGHWSHLDLPGAHQGLTGGARNFIHTIAQLGDATWVATANGIFKYDGKTFTRLGGWLDSADLFATYDGHLWFCNGLSRVDCIVNDSLETRLRIMATGGLSHMRGLTGVLADKDGLLVGAWAMEGKYPQQSPGPVLDASSGNPPLFRFDGQRWTAIGAEQGLKVAYADPRHVDRQGGIWLHTDLGDLILQGAQTRPALPEIPPFTEAEARVDRLAASIRERGMDALSPQDKAFAERLERLAPVMPPAVETAVDEWNKGFSELAPKAEDSWRFSLLSEDDKRFWRDNLKCFWGASKEVRRWLVADDDTLLMQLDGYLVESRDGTCREVRLLDGAGKEVDPLHWKTRRDVELQFPTRVDANTGPAKESPTEIQIQTIVSQKPGVYWIGTNSGLLLKLERIQN